MLQGMPQRQAALLLHALAPTDQAWLLASLPEQDSIELTNLLQELRDMNVTPDAAWLAQWLPTTESNEDANDLSSNSPASNSHAELIKLKPHQVNELARLLSVEPVQLTLRLLRVQPWPWREKLLSQMTASAQMRLRQSLRDLTADADLAGGTSLALNQALVDVLARRMAQTERVAASDHSEPTDNSVPSFPRRLVELLRRAVSAPGRVLS
jgi:hypothetical protein